MTDVPYVHAEHDIFLRESVGIHRTSVTICSHRKMVPRSRCEMVVSSSARSLSFQSHPFVLSLFSVLGAFNAIMVRLHVALLVSLLFLTRPCIPRIARREGNP